MEQEFISIAKKPGIKNCVRISGQSDIPEFLQDVVKIDEDTIILDCLEGEERAPIGSVIAFEKLESGKMNVWNKANWKETTREVNGVFYELPKTNMATPVTETLPEAIVSGLGERLKRLEDGSFQIDAGWGLVTCAPNNGYLVVYGKKDDGTLDANFLTKGTPSFQQYYIVNEQGNIVQTLSEYDEQLQQINKPRSL